MASRRHEERRSVEQKYMAKSKCGRGEPNSDAELSETAFTLEVLLSS